MTELKEFKPLVVPQFEEARVIKNVGNGANIEQVLANMKERISSCIAHAPEFSDDEEINLDSEKLISHSLVLKYPEDAHFFAMIEREVFKQLWELNAKLQKNGDRVSQYSLMSFDERLSTLSATVDDNQTISGETYIDHEQRHAQTAMEAGHGSVYITVPFIWLKDKDGRRSLQMFHATAQIREEFSPVSVIATALAPKYPSASDFAGAERTLQEITSDENMDESLRVMARILKSYPRYNGKRLHYERMQELFLPLWQQLLAPTVD